MGLGDSYYYWLVIRSSCSKEVVVKSIRGWAFLKFVSQRILLRLQILEHWSSLLNGLVFGIFK